MRELKNNKFNKGITLVALVVTIVVLLILAGVSINLVLGENGLITQAKEAKNKTLQTEENETQLIDNASNYIIQTVADLPKNDETKPYMPSSEFSTLEGTNLDNGLVIQDASGNQYVWIEVPMTVAVYPTAGLNITEFTTDAYTKIENDLHTYTSTYRNENCKDEFCEDSTDGWFENVDKYNEVKQKMLKGIYQNGGFWVARYEAGISENRASYTEPTEIPMSKANLYPYTFITRAKAQKLATKVQYGECKGSLIFGIQWDLILTFMQNKGNVSEKILNDDSTTIGNYYGTTYTINRGMYAKYGEMQNAWNKYTVSLPGIIENKIKIEQTSNQGGILLTTGAVDRNRVMNIYDIAGNIWEWTLEKSSEENSPCVYRGGNFSDATGKAVSRQYYATNIRNGHVGFRIVLY